MNQLTPQNTKKNLKETWRKAREGEVGRLVKPVWMGMKTREGRGSELSVLVCFSKACISWDYSRDTHPSSLSKHCVNVLILVFLSGHWKWRLSSFFFFVNSQYNMACCCVALFAECLPSNGQIRKRVVKTELLLISSYLQIKAPQFTYNQIELYVKSLKSNYKLRL